jgi:hypothetical protein
MSNAAKFPVIAAALAIVGAASSPAARAQSVSPTPASFTPITADAALAQALHERAAVLLTDTRRQAAAAALLVEASSLRASDDPTSVKDLLVAGKLYAYANNNRAARTTLERAAARALEFGDQVTAAHAYVDAAFIAIRQKDWETMRALTTSAERIANSPAVAAAQRADILTRINPARVAAGSR